MSATERTEDKEMEENTYGQRTDSQLQREDHQLR